MSSRARVRHEHHRLNHNYRLNFSSIFYWFLYNNKFVFTLIYFIVENLIGMLYSDVAERNVGKSLTLETLAKAQGIVGAAACMGTPFMIVLVVSKQKAVFQCMLSVITYRIQC